MLLQSADGNRTLDTGNGELAHSIYSTAFVRTQYLLPQVTLAIQFLQLSSCPADAALETARQLNLIRDAFAQIPPEEAVFDWQDISRQAPWSGNLSPVITSCANLYTTADGQDLLFEMVSILVYASVAGVDVLKID